MEGGYDSQQSGMVPYCNYQTSEYHGSLFVPPYQFVPYGYMIPYEYTYLHPDGVWNFRPWNLAMQQSAPPSPSPSPPPIWYWNNVDYERRFQMQKERLDDLITRLKESQKEIRQQLSDTRQRMKDFDCEGTCDRIYERIMQLRKTNAAASSKDQDQGSSI